MRLSSILLTAGTLIAAGILAVFTARFAVSTVEDSTEIAVRQSLDEAGHDWAEVQANGLQVLLTGTAATEAVRFRAISQVGTVIDAARIINATTVMPTTALAAPRFSAEILRNDSGISIIGLVPASTDREALVDGLTAATGEARVAELLQTADYPAPRGWVDALGFASAVLERLPRSKISVEAGRVTVTAIADSLEERDALEADLSRSAPPGLRLALDVAAPRPVVTPFTLRFIIDEEGGHFDACTADTRDAMRQIILAARSAGMDETGDCTIAMGTPTPRWAAAASQAIRALSDLGRGSVTFSDADITLIAAEGTDQGMFDRVVGELESTLPPVFALHPVLPRPEAGDAGPPEFTATLSPEGLVQLRGRLNDEGMRNMADSLARARFGTDNVYSAARIVPDLPSDWSLRVLAGLEALSWLANGMVLVSPDKILLQGTTNVETARSDIASLLSQKLGEAEEFALDITYRAPPPPADLPPPPDVCEEQIAGVLAGGKIRFEPGSATIDPGSLPVMDTLAEILSNCGDLRMEIQGHTDSQGREEMNQQLSQARAQSVLNELRARRVLTSTYAAVGYGETKPIADNDTEAGREQNRRIEFVLIRPETLNDGPSALDELARDGRNSVSSKDTTDEQN